MKNFTLQILPVFLFSILFTYYVSAETTMIEPLVIVNDNFIVGSDTILRQNCSEFQEIELVPKGAQFIGRDTILVCVYDTIVLDPGPGLIYDWDNHSTEQTYRVHTSGLGFDIQTHWLRAEDFETGCFDTAWITVIFSFAQCTGLAELDQNAFEIYPNPGNGLVNLRITSIQGDVQLEVLDLNGQLKYQESYSIASEESTLPIDLTNLSDGFYMIRLIGDDFIYTEKVIKQ